MPDFDPKKFLKEQSQSNSFDPKKYLEENTIEKKSPIQPVAPITSRTSSVGLEPFLPQVNTNIPSVLTQKGKVGYEEDVQQKSLQKQNLSEQLKNAQRAYASAQGQGLAEEIASLPMAEQGQVTQAEPSYENIAPLLSNLQSVTSSFYKIPRYVYDVFAMPQNLAAEALNIPELKADYDQVSKGTYNPLGVLDRVGDYSSGKAKEWESKQRKYDDDIVTQLSKGDFANAGLQIFDNIVASAPSIAAMYLTGGASNAAKLGTLSKTLATALPFASAQNQQLADNENIPDWLKPVNSAFNAVSEVIFEEKFGTKAILDGLTKVVETQGKDIAIKSAKDFIYNYIKKALSKIQPVTDVLANSIEEGATRASQNIIAKITGEDSNRKIMDGVANATIVGGAQGLGASALRKGFDLIPDKKAKTKVDDLNKKREDLTNDLSNESLPNNVKEQIADKIENINEQINNELDVNRDKINNLPEETKSEVSQLSDKIESIKESLQDKTISETTKSLLEEDLKSTEAELDAKFKIAKPTFDTEELLIEEGKKAEEEYKKTGDQVTYEQKIKELEEREKNLVPAPEKTPEQQVEQLRADEQQELIEAIPNAEQYIVDGKVDRNKITDAEDLKKFDEIYDKYDKLITPLLPETEIKPTKPKENAIQIETAGQVPVQPEATVSEEVVEGKPEAKPEIVTEEGKEEINKKDKVVLSDIQKQAYEKLSNADKKLVDELIYDENYERSIGSQDVLDEEGLDLEDEINKSAVSFEDLLNRYLNIPQPKIKVTAKNEVFTFGKNKYNINKANEIISGESLKPVNVPVDVLPKLSYSFISIDEDTVNNADITKPVIIAKTKDGLLLIDGHHRVRKAIIENKPIKAFVLNETQTNQITGQFVPTVKQKPAQQVVTEEGVKTEEVVAEEDVYKDIVDKEFSKIGTLSLDKIPTDRIVESDNPRKNRSRHNEIMKTVAKLNKLIKCK